MAVFRLLTIQPPITKSRPVRGNFVSKSRGFVLSAIVESNLSGWLYPEGPRLFRVSYPRSRVRDEAEAHRGQPEAAQRRPSTHTTSRDERSWPGVSIQHFTRLGPQPAHHHSTFRLAVSGIVPSCWRGHCMQLQTPTPAATCAVQRYSAALNEAYSQNTLAEHSRRAHS
jgi:hypothetical protein